MRRLYVYLVVLVMILIIGAINEYTLGYVEKMVPTAPSAPTASAAPTAPAAPAPTSASLQSDAVDAATTLSQLLTIQLTDLQQTVTQHTSQIAQLQTQLNTMQLNAKNVVV